MNENKSKSKVVFVSFIIAIIVIVSVFAAVVIPNFIRAHAIRSGQPCVNNLRQIDAAANQFALENRKKNGDSINFPNDLTPYIKLNSEGKIASCPWGGVYSIKRVGDKPTCSLGNKVTDGCMHIMP
jgi:competence protein ComGC